MEKNIHISLQINKCYILQVNILIIFFTFAYAVYYLASLCVPELPADSSVKTLDTKTLFVRVLPTTAEA